MVAMMMANLSFVLLKINDTDIGQLQQEKRDAAAALNILLNNESENVVLHLKRKACWNLASKCLVDDNDEIEISKKICFLKIQPNTGNASAIANNAAPSSTEIIVNLHLPNSSACGEEDGGLSKSTQTDDMAYYVHEQLRNMEKDTERLIEEEHNLFEQSLAPEIDIEEITLRKTHSDERLGLTVCYSNGEEYGEIGGEVGGSGGSGGSGNEMYGGTSGVTEVYISDIHVDSVAGRDGRLRQGDQILQINGKDITTREETETLIAENNNAVTLLISRYLYGEDDFNDPSTNEEDDEVLVVEDDEDDDDEEEFYDENNMTYVNCIANNECCLNNVDDFDKAIMSQVEQQKQQQDNTQNNSVLEATSATLPSNLNKLKGAKIEKKSSNSSRNNVTATTKNASNEANKATTLSVIAPKANPTDNKTSDYYESEHIYETIPEDPESEPFYCSPYDSSVYVTAIASCSSSTATDALQQQMQHKQRVVQWLGINSSQGVCNTAIPRHSLRSSSGCGRSLKNRHKTATGGTIRSTMTSLTNGSIDGIGSAMTLPASQVDDQDNSSSAYNTGGSNNSVSPHSLLLNPKTRTEAYQAAAGCMPPMASASSIDDVIGMQQLLLQHKIASQQKILSPKDKNKITSPKSGNKMSVMEMQGQSAVTGAAPGGGKLAMFTNSEASAQRSAMLPQHLLKQTIPLDKMMHQPYYQHQIAATGAADQIHCPQFTAPNLSQYHFVSSQEVNNLSLNNKIPKSSPAIAETTNNNSKNNADEEEAMVWKVKRRPDGTRYIVRRPAKSRVVKERNVRLNVERLRDENTTTEDDTMSEIKTGRYWTREERKKHIERAKERRQQQQLQYQQQLQQLQQQKITMPYEENAADLQDREQVRHANFQSFTRQKYRQHYQLQFNSAAHSDAVQKHKSSLTYHNASTAGTTADDGTTDQAEVGGNLTTITTTTSASNLITSSERNNLNSNMISVTTV
ncbi:slo-interacting protein 1 [Stomoxys calcitrans]|uniref:PDZ domain-containing protein n=1 Tax=Stomoxys calcitrans TaxID=35570 RepID=A0A1I8PAA9_STOCA|nr:slo-interacting protein 1 [Stomoxys calcitrans]